MSHFKKRWKLFRHSAFAWYILSCFLANLGGGMNYIAMTWLVLDSHFSQISAVSILMFCFWLPNIVLGPILGVLVDRYSRHAMVFLANFIRGIIIFAFVLFVGVHYTPTTIFAIALMLGTTFALYGPASFAFIREIIPEKDLLYANATVDMAYELGNVLGMGGIGLLLAWVNLTTTISINGILFILAALPLLFIKNKTQNVKQLDPQNNQDQPINSERKQQKSKKNFWDDFILALKYILQHRAILIFYSIQLILTIQVMVTPVLLAPFAKQILHTNVSQFGQIEMCLSFGLIIGGIFIPWLADKIGLMRASLLMMLCLSSCFLLFASNDQIFFAKILYLIIGFALAIWALIITKAQSITDLSYQGRVQSCFNSLSGLGILLFYVLLNIGSSHINVRHLYCIEVILSLMACCLIFLARKTSVQQKNEVILKANG